MSRPNAFHASFRLTRDVAFSGRCQTRGGRKGGAPVCEENGLCVQGVVIFAKLAGNVMIDDDVPAKLKHFSAQVAMVPQWSMAGPHGFALGGQQSCMSSIADMSAFAGDLTLTPTPAAAGSIATDRATRSAKTVRPMLIYLAWKKIVGPLVLRSSGEFASLLALAVFRRTLCHACEP